MSNEDLIKKFYVAFKNNDKDTYLNLCDDALQWQTAEGMPNGGKYVGKEEIFEKYFPNMLANFIEFHAIPEQILDMKDHVLVTGRYRGISKKKKNFEVSFSHVYHIQKNKIIQFRQFVDTKKILDSLN